MTDNLPAVPAPPTREVATIDTDSWVEVMRPIIALADRIYDTEFVPRGLRGSAPATAAAMLYGREVGLPPMTALNMTHVVEGKPGLSAEGMRAVVLAQGHEIEFVETTGAKCTMRARRRGADNWTQLTWTIDAARQAGLTGKNVWKSYPRVMLQARCTTELCRMVFPDVIHGFRSVEELEDMGGVDLDDSGAEQPAPSTRVTRKRATARKTAAAALPAPVKPAERPEGPAGPPLPGEDGYDDDTAPTGAQEQAGEEGESDDGDTSSHGESTGNDREDTPTPAVEAGEPGEDGAETSPSGDPGSPEPPTEPTPPAAGVRKASKAQHRMIFASLGNLYGSDECTDEERLLVASIVAGRAVESFNDLFSHEAKAIIDTLSRCRDRAQLMQLLDTIEEAQAEEQAAAEAGDES